MAINIPNRRTLMDHLADVGSRYVQNKAETDRQRMAQEFQIARDEQFQAFQTGIAEGQNELSRDQIRLTGEQNKLLQEGRYAGEGQLQSGRYVGEGTLLDKTIAGTLAQATLNSGDVRYGIDSREKIAKGGFANNIALGNINRYSGQDAIAGNQALEELKSKTNIELMGMSNQVRRELQSNQNDANLLQLMNSLDAELQWRREDGASRERIAGIGADVVLDTNATNQQMNADSNFSREITTGITADAATQQTNTIQSAETEREGLRQTGATKRAKLSDDTQRFGMKKAAEMERMRLDSAFETLETTLEWQGKQNEGAVARQLIENRIIEYQFDESKKNQYVKALNDIEPILKMKGVTKEQYLADPETYSEVLSKAVDRNNLYEIIGSAAGFSPGYKTTQEKQKSVDDALQSLLFLNALAGNPAHAGANGLNNIVN